MNVDIDTEGMCASRLFLHPLVSFIFVSLKKYRASPFSLVIRKHKDFFSY